MTDMTSIQIAANAYIALCDATVDQDAYIPDYYDYTGGCR